MERELGWWRKYFFSTDHKVLGHPVGDFGPSFFSSSGFGLMMLMLLQLAYHGQTAAEKLENCRASMPAVSYA